MSKTNTRKKQPPKNLAEWLINKYNTKKWRAGEVSGVTTTESFHDIREILGSQEFKRQIRELEREGYIAVKWKNVNTDVEKIITNRDRLEELCEREGMPSPRSVFQLHKDLVLTMKQDAKKNPEAQWLVDFYSGVLEKLEDAERKLPDIAQDVELFQCLNALSLLKEDVWIRRFSTQVLHYSKAFENKKFKSRIANVLRKYTDSLMDDEEILAEYHLLSYSQTLEYKGSMQYAIQSLGCETMIDGGKYYYGDILNAQTMEHSRPVSIHGVKRIITIENKANYESQNYDESTLYIYTHGFMSRKERVFLGLLNEILPEEVDIYHWSDMDYGGLRIFKYMKERVFIGRKIQPYKMGPSEYKEALVKRAEWKVFGEDDEGVITTEMRAKIEAVDIPELEELKQCILKYNIVFEQEEQLD